jgi:hypothetical protein
MIITSATPSDGHRWWRNTLAQMQRALPAEPKRVRPAASTEAEANTPINA